MVVDVQGSWLAGGEVSARIDNKSISKMELPSSRWVSESIGLFSDSSLRLGILLLAYLLVPDP